MYLMVEFPRVRLGEKEYSIVYYEKVCVCVCVGTWSKYITLCGSNITTM